jgi:hypothetical protein
VSGVRAERPVPNRSRYGRVVIAGLILIVLLVGIDLLNRAATSVVEGGKFREMLEKETAKGMHFQSAHYAPITRVGVFGMKADSGTGEKGFKTIVSMTGNHVTGSFNPLGIFLKRWQLEFLHFDSGTVMLQKTDSNPNAAKPPGQPWYLFFWPDHVYLKDIKVDQADVLFKLQEKESGIHGTFLEITPNGRDFEYDAKGGTFKIPVAPQLNVEHIHLLVRKPRLTCNTLVLGDDPAHPEEQVRIEGEAGLQQDRGITAQADFDHLQVAPWLPENMRSHVLGRFNGHVDYKSTGTGLETSQAEGDLSVIDGVLHGIKAVKTYVDATRSPDPGDLKLEACQVHVRMNLGAVSLEKIEVESQGVFRLTGTIHMAKDKSLSGELQLGLTSPYLHWLPTAETAIFTRTEGPYHFASVQISGTSQKPHQDLSARILKEIGNHPLVALKLFFNGSGDLF